jgi:Metal-sensitive transcriptional repressor
MPSDDGPARSGILETRPRLGYGSIMRKAMKVACQKRLGKIEGSGARLSRMVDEDRYCIDIVTQVPGPVGGAVIDEDLPCGECFGPAAFVEGFRMPAADGGATYKVFARIKR